MAYFKGIIVGKYDYSLSCRELDEKINTTLKYLEVTERLRTQHGRDFPTYISSKANNALLSLFYSKWTKNIQKEHHAVLKKT